MSALSKLGIDWKGIVLYVINFGILFFVLGRLLYRPLLKFLDERREAIKKNVDEAEELRKTLAAELAKRDQEMKIALEQMHKEVEETKALAEERARELVQEAEKQRAAMLGEARALISEMKARVHEEVASEVLARVEKMVQAILRDKVSPDVVKKSVAETWREVADDVTV